MTWHLRCLLGIHDDDVMHAPMRMRCTRCRRETPGWDVGPAPTPKFAGHLTTADVQRIRQELKRSPAYVTPQVEAELAASEAKARARKRRGPAVVAPIRRSA